MTAEEQRPEDVNGEQVPAGSEGTPSGPAPHSAEEPESDSLTVEDILAAAERAQSETGAGAEAAGEGEVGDEGQDGAQTETEEDPHGHLEDLRRLTAEYANYRKRTEANAGLEKQRAIAAAVSGLLPVLDDLDRAEAHGDLEEGSAFTTIAQKVRSALEKMGLEGYGEKGEPFDPQVHEAIAQVPVPGTEEPVVLDVVERGYRVGDVELRPAKVAVAVGADG